MKLRVSLKSVEVYFTKLQQDSTHAFLFLESGESLLEIDYCNKISEVLCFIKVINCFYRK